jgi:hypothetical protein
MKSTRLALGVAVMLALGLAVPVQTLADPVAYWRHEEGPLGGDVPPGFDSVLDATGNGNHMTTFNDFTGATYTSQVSPLPLRSGLPNLLSLDFDLDQDGAGPDLNDDNFTPGKPIDSYVFNAVTVELAFNMDSVGPGQYQTLVGKDGNPGPGPLPPLAVKVRGDDFPGGIDNQLQFEFLDGDGDEISLASGMTIQTGEWYHMAAVVTATTADMYLAIGEGDYMLVDSLTDDFAGPGGEVFLDFTGTFTVGRGMFGGGIADWSDALIDEVRFSDAALGPDEFLFLPEPTSLSFVILAAATLLRRRR